jgi:hypothetical protein
MLVHLSQRKYPGILSEIALFFFLIGYSLLSARAQDTRETTSTPVPDLNEPPSEILPQVTDIASSPEKKAPGKTLPPGVEKKVSPVFRITSQEFLDYDEASNFIYGRARTKIWYKDVYLEADRLIYDIRLNEVQAFGNIILKAKDDEYRADSLWYSMDKGRGFAFRVKGRHKQIFISSNPQERDVPSFELLSQTEEFKVREALFRKSSYTTCDFPVPHFRISCSEILLYPDDRIFFKSATFYVWDLPIFYLPVYTRALKESFPWSFNLGYSSKLGGYVRLAYDFHHGEYEPELGREDKWREKSQGHLSAYLDYFSRRGLGYGAKYKYLFEYGAHGGMWDLYGISDRRFDVNDYSDRKEVEEEDAFPRWIARIKHRSRLMEGLSFQLNMDEMSDPDVYYDLLDRFNTEKRRRIPERDIQAALTYARDDYIGRLLFQIRNRIGRNRVTNYASPGDNDADFDIDPYHRDDVGDYEGFVRNRYGRVSEKLPQFTFSTNELILGSAPFYTYTDINLINNLDKGLNTVGTMDDAWVRGGDLYQALLHRWRITRDYTLSSRLGIGASYVVREKDEFDYDFPSGATFPYDQPPDEGGLTLLDEETFLVGRRQFDRSGNLITTAEQLEEWRTRSLEDVEKYYLYSDLMEYFHARFTNYLNGWIRYDFREGTKDSLGEFYESLGNTLSRRDLYNFRLPEHWIRSGLDYFLLYPNITAHLIGGYNLQKEKDIYPNEELYYATVGMLYVDNSETFRLTSSLKYSGRQEYDPSDPMSGQVNHLYGILSGQYIPLSKLWWSRLSLSGHRVVSERKSGYQQSGFSEYNTELDVTGVLGGKIGPKYTLEGQVTYKERLSGNGISYIGSTVKRDLHDFIVAFMIGWERDIRKERYVRDKVEGDMNFDFNVSIELKSPYQKSTLAATSTKTLLDSAKEASIAGDQNTIPLFTGR